MFRSRSSNRLVLLGIVSLCLISVYVLFQKVVRVVGVIDLEKKATSEATIVSITRRETFRGIDNIWFLIHSKDPFPADFFCKTSNSTDSLESRVKITTLGPSSILRGQCDSVSNSHQILITNSQFSVEIELDEIKAKPSTVCIGYALMYEDTATLTSILDYYADDKVVLYGDSWDENIMKEINNRDISTVPWPIFEEKTETPDKLNLTPDMYKTAQDLTLADCWMKHGPSSTRLTYVRLNQIVFSNNKSMAPLGNESSLFFDMDDTWSLDRFNIAQVVQNKKHSLQLSQLCHSRVPDKKCLSLSPFNNLQKTKIRQIIDLKKSSTTKITPSSYQSAFNKCTISSSKHDKEHKQSEVSTEASCMINIPKQGYKCRTAVSYSKKMFKDLMKVNVVHKRAMRRHSDGCRR